MTAESLDITYASDADTVDSWVNLEQKSVATNRLSMKDLQQMLTMVINGVSARAYTRGDCPATIKDGEVSMALVVWAWPSALDLAYTLNPTLGELGDRVATQQEREFNLEINFAEKVDLPFYCTNISWEWTNIPCFDKYGNEVDRPKLTATPTKIMTPGNIYTVIRVRCLAHGYAHPLTIGFSKTGAVAISDIEATAQAIWENAGEAKSTDIELNLPTCAEQLLATCEDGKSIVESVYGAISDSEEPWPVGYYNGCTGRMLVVRHEQ